MDYTDIRRFEDELGLSLGTPGLSLNSGGSGSPEPAGGTDFSSNMPAGFSLGTPGLRIDPSLFYPGGGGGGGVAPPSVGPVAPPIPGTAPAAEAPKTSNSFTDVMTKKYGGLPLYGWGLVGLGSVGLLVLGVRLIRR